MLGGRIIIIIVIAIVILLIVRSGYRDSQIP
jgi:hypothetical protein